MDILLADRQPKVRFALWALLRRQAGIEVVREAGNAQEILLQAQAARPDVVLLDWSLCNGRTSDLLGALHVACPGLYVIALDVQPEMRGMALAAGADAFVCKADPPECLLAAVRCAQRVGQESG